MNAPVAELKGETRTYRVQCFGTNLQCRVEELTGKPFWQILTILRSPQPPDSALRAFLAAALVDPSAPTLEEAGRIMDDIGGPAVIRSAIHAVLGTIRKRPTRQKRTATHAT